MTKKILAGFLGLSMALMMFPGMAQGVTDEEWEELMDQFEELQEKYDELLALYTTLLGGTPTPGDVPAACVGTTSFTRDLYQGMSGDDVKCLQALLNTDPATQLNAVAGNAGSLGYETTFFGPLTHGAVVKFQNLHAAEILTPIGLTAGTGYVGPATRPVLDAMLVEEVDECVEDDDCLPGFVCELGECVPEPIVECETDEDCDEGYVCEDEICVEEIVEPTEGWIEARWLPTPTGVEVNWGASNVAVGAIELEARDSDITVNRIDILFQGATPPWHKIDYLALYDGDSAVKGTDINSGTLSEVAFGTDYRLRLTGLDIDVSEDEEKDITIKVNTPTIPRTPGALTMTIAQDAIRGIDTAGIYQYAGCANNRQFTVAAAGLGARVETQINADTPEEGFAIIDPDVATDHEVLAFDLDVTRNSAQVRTVTVTLSTTTNINAVMLYDGATAIGSEAAAVTTTFTDLEVGIAEDTTKTLTVEVEYAATDTAGTLTASIAAGDVIAASANEEACTYTGSATGDAIYFWEVAPDISLSSASIELVEDQTDKANTQLVFRVEALGGDIFVSATATDIVASSTASTTDYDFDETGLTATAANSYRIPEDQSETFTIAGYLDNNAGTAGFFDFFLSLFTWDTVDGGTTNAWTHTNWMVQDITTETLHLSD